MDLLAEEICARGGRVTWWSTTFDHRRKRDVTPRGDRYEIRPRYEVILTHAAGYKRNISIDRLRFNRATAREFASRAVSEPQPDLILSSYPTIELVSAVGAYGRARGIPTVADVRDLWPDIWVDVAPSVLRPFARALLARYFGLSKTALASVDAVSGVTDEFVSWGLRRAERSSTSLDRAFPFGYRVPSLSQAERDEAGSFWRTALHQNTYDPVLRLCFIGGIGVRTGIAHVVDAVLGLPDQIRKKIQLVVCGDGVDGQLTPLKQRAGRDPAVVFSGWVDQAKLMTLMDISDLGIVPFPNTVDFQNSLSNKAIEYLAGGLAIATGLDGKLRKLITDHNCGYVYANQDAASLAALLTDVARHPDTLAQRKVAARELFQREFRAEAVYSAFVDHLEDIAAAAPARIMVS